MHGCPVPGLAWTESRQILHETVVADQPDSPKGSALSQHDALHRRFVFIRSPWDRQLVQRRTGKPRVRASPAGRRQPNPFGFGSRSNRSVSRERFRIHGPHVTRQTRPGRFPRRFLSGSQRPTGAPRRVHEMPPVNLYVNVRSNVNPRNFCKKNSPVFLTKCPVPFLP
jgi:hypothetical protein